MLCVIAGLGKFGSAIRAFTNSNEVKELRAKLADSIKENTEIRGALAEAVAAQKNLAQNITNLINSDQFLANREKADFAKMEELCGRLSTLYNMITDKTRTPVTAEEVTNDANNQEA